MGKCFRIWLVVLVSCAGSMSTGCSYLRELVGFVAAEPEVNLKQLSVKDISFRSLDLEVLLTVKNPNRFKLTLKDLTYSMETMGATVADGTFGQAFEVPPHGQSDLLLPLRINPSQALGLIKRLMAGEKEAIAVLRADAVFDSFLGPLKVKMENTRNLSELVKISP